MRNLIFSALICFVCSLQPALYASPKKPIKQTEISEIIVTQYTGGDESPEYMYRLLLRRDGTAVYVGNATYMERIGRYHGKITKPEFVRYTNLFRQNSFPKWQEPISDEEKNRIASERFEIVENGKRKVAVVYDNSESQAARRASKTFYGLLWKINWQKVSDSDTLSEYHAY